MADLTLLTNWTALRTDLHRAFAVLKASDRQLLEDLARKDAFARQTIRHLLRVVTSEAFRSSQERTRNFLCFVVGLRLLGRADQVKQTTVAMAVFGQSASFDPLENSIVRVAGSALRHRLRRYYESEGRHDLVRILLSPGSYVPEIQDQRVDLRVHRFGIWSGRQDTELGRALKSELAIALVGLRRFVGPNSQAMRQHYELRGAIALTPATTTIHIALLSLHTDRIVYTDTLSAPRTQASELPRRASQTLESFLQQPPPLF